MVVKRSITQDAYGAMLIAQMERGEKLCEFIERDDDFIDTGSVPGYYITEYRQWSSAEKQAIKTAAGRVLDIGCGAGRHSLYLQEKGLDVTGIDNSRGAILVCKKRGLRKALVRSIDEVSKFGSGYFDTVLMMGNNFGLVAGRMEQTFKDLDRITTQDATIITGTRNPYGTENPTHVRYHRLNKKRGRMAGHLTIRARFEDLIGPWFDYLLISPEEMESVLEASAWKINKILGDADANYFAILKKSR